MNRRLWSLRYHMAAPAVTPTSTLFTLQASSAALHETAERSIRSARVTTEALQIPSVPSILSPPSEPSDSRTAVLELRRAAELHAQRSAVKSEEQKAIELETAKAAAWESIASGATHGDPTGLPTDMQEALSVIGRPAAILSGADTGAQGAEIAQRHCGAH